MDTLPLTQVQCLERQYRVLGTVGRGAMGLVLEGVDRQSGDRVALKVLRPIFAQDPRMVGRFLREGQAAAQLRTEHAVRIYDIGDGGGIAPFIAMEFLEGTDLEQEIEQRRFLPFEEAVMHVLHSCEAVAAAHSHGTIHRDLKPSNVFLARGPNGERCVKVLDFGIAAVAASRGLNALTSKDEIVGTPAYMAPEQIRSAREAGVASDIWALGIILYEAIAGRHPFPAPTPLDMMIQISQQDAPRLDATRADVPPGLADAVARCLRRDPRSRYTNVGELAAALGRFGSEQAAPSVRQIFRALTGG